MPRKKKQEYTQDTDLSIIMDDKMDNGLKLFLEEIRDNTRDLKKEFVAFKEGHREVHNEIDKQLNKLKNTHGPNGVYNRLTRGQKVGYGIAVAAIFGPNLVVGIGHILAWLGSFLTTGAK